MLLKLALKDLMFDRLISACQVAAIASILAPLLLLFSLRYGIINELEDKLLQDPKVLSLTLDTSYRLDVNFFDQLMQQPEVGFVIPEVSALSALIDIRFPNGAQRVSVMATALGDPVVLNSGIDFSHTGEFAKVKVIKAANDEDVNTVVNAVDHADSITTNTTNTSASTANTAATNATNTANADTTATVNTIVESANKPEPESKGNANISSETTANTQVNLASNTDVSVESNSEPESEPISEPEPQMLACEKAWYEGGLQDHEIFVSEDLATERKIKFGDKLMLVVSRTIHGERQASRQYFTVKGIIKQRFVNDDFVVTNLKVLTALDDYRNGFEPEIFSDGSYVKTTPRYFAKFRLFATDIDAVIPLYYKLVNKHFSVSSKVGEIENIQAISRVLNFIFAVIALVSGIGGALALSGLMLSSLKSRKRNFVLLRLMGQSTRETYLLVLLENFLLSSLGFILAWLFYLAGSQVFNHYFGALLPEALISHLTIAYGLLFYVATVLIAAILALLSAKYIFLKARIADVLREA